MKVHSRIGSTRLSFIGKHVTVKIPEPDIASIQVDSIAWRFRQVRLSRFLRDLLGSEDEDSSILFGIQGMFANRREAQCWKKLRGIVLPTRALFAGAIATQPTTEDVPLEAEELRAALYRAIGRRDIHREGAVWAFEEAENFGCLGGRILMKDFGDWDTPEFLFAHRDAIRRELEKLAMKLE